MAFPLRRTNLRFPADADDHLKHLGMGNRTHDLPKMFGDVKVSSFSLEVGIIIVSSALEDPFPI